MNNYKSNLYSFKRIKNCLLLSALVVLYSCQTPQSHLPQSEAANLEQKLWHHTYQTLDGKTVNPVTLSSRIVMINFWASWCLPCMQELPSLLQLAKNYNKNELTIISVNVDTEDQLVNLKKVHRKFKITDEFIHVADESTKLADSVPFTAIPVTVIFKNGKAIELFSDPVDFQSPLFLNRLKQWLE